MTKKKERKKKKKKEKKKKKGGKKKIPIESSKHRNNMNETADRQNWHKTLIKSPDHNCKTNPKRNTIKPKNDQIKSSTETKEWKYTYTMWNQYKNKPRREAVA